MRDALIKLRLFAIAALSIALVVGTALVLRASISRRQAERTAAEPARFDDPRLGRIVDGFELPDVDGRRVALGDFADQRLVVIAFLGVECPLAQVYGDRLADMARRYGPRGVAFLGIDPNRQDAAEDLKQFGIERNIEFPLLMDVGNRIADHFEAERTPEIHVLDESRAVRYLGRIDDQYGVGYRRFDPRRRDLEIALGELLAGKEVSVPVTVAPGCLIGRVRDVEPEGEVTWSNQIARIFQHRCQECHRPGAIAPFALLDYEQVQGWAEMIAEVVSQKRMPPWHADPRYGHFANDMSLTDEERGLILAWVRHGAPEGDAAELPPPRQFAEGWPMGEPDEVIYMSDVPYDVPAQGRAVYKYFFVDPGYTEGRWIKASWCLPDNPAVVHHINVYFKPPWQSWTHWVGGTVNLVSGFLPGQLPPPLEFQGTALYVPAGSEFVFEMHYTPNGTPQKDRSSVGLIYAEPEEVTREALHVCAYNDRFAIPPHAENHRVEATYTFDQAAQLEFLNVHMHLRGKDFLFTALYPDGTRETLLKVNGYDYEWQTVYWLAETKPMPAGTQVHCVAHYDNSLNNPRNPDPNQTVRWSGYTEDEMMVGTLGISRPKPPPGREAGYDPDNVPPMPDYFVGHAGDVCFDRGRFLQGRGDVRAAFEQYDLALAAYAVDGPWRGRANVWITKALVLFFYYLPKLLIYVIAVSVLAAAISVYDAVAAWRGWWRWPRALRQLVALAGGSPVMFVLDRLLLRPTPLKAERLRMMPIFAVQLVATVCVAWVAIQYY